MKFSNFLLSVLFSFISVSCAAQQANPNYDLEMAQKFDADDYGMKSYVLVILTTPAEPASNFSQDLMRGHLDNINRLVEEGALLVAGPFMQNENGFRGLYIFNVKTVEEAKELVSTDPAIQAGVFDVIYAPWYGSAALGAYLDYSDKVWKVKP